MFVCLFYPLVWVAHPKSTPRGVRVLLGVARFWCAWAVGSLRQLLLDGKPVQRAIFISKTVFFENYFFVGGWLVAFIVIVCLICSLSLVRI
jgi:hypothetical protein